MGEQGSQYAEKGWFRLTGLYYLHTRFSAEQDIRPFQIPNHVSNRPRSHYVSVANYKIRRPSAFGVSLGNASAIDNN